MADKISWTPFVKDCLRGSVEECPGSKLNWEQITEKFREKVRVHNGIPNGQKLLINKIQDLEKRLRTSFSRFKKEWTKIEVFSFNEESNTFLIEIFENILTFEGHENWPKIHKEFIEKFPNYKSNSDALKRQYNKIRVPKENVEDEYQIDWKSNPEFNQILHDVGATYKAHNNVIYRRKGFSKEQIYQEIWKRFCNKTNLKPSYASVRRQIIGMSLLNVLNFGEENDRELKVNTMNMPETDIRWLSFYQYGLHFRTKPLFDAICHRCGQLLRESVGRGHKFYWPQKIDPEKDIIPVKTMYQLEKIVRFPYKDEKSGKYFVCRNCFNNKNVYLAEQFRLVPGIYSGNLRFPDISLPNEIDGLKTHWEKSVISLTCMLSNTLMPKTLCKNQFAVNYGTSKVTHRNDQAYYRLCFLALSEDPHKKWENEQTPEEVKQMHRNVVQAIKWLKKHNKLYQTFYCHYETLYRYFTKGNPVQIFGGIDYRKTNKMDLIRELIGDEKVVMLVPSLDMSAEDIEMYFSPDQDIAAQAHPKTKELKLSEKQHKAALVQLLWPKFSDFYLCAKIFVHLYPYGLGSYVEYKNMKFTLMDYSVFRLLNLDDRWRKDKDFAFYLCDRVWRKRIYDFNQNTVRTVNPHSAIDKTAGQIKEQKMKSTFDRLGSRLPPNLPGSKSFWRTKQSNLQAMCSHFGSPTFFVTLTENDYSPEMQSIFKDFDEIFKVESHSFISQPINASGHPIVGHPVEAVLYMNKYLKHFMAKFVKNPKSPFGKNIAYFIRHEYQSRGAVHYHILLWSEPDSFDEKSIVMAEMPRGEKNPDRQYDIFVQTLRKMVKKFQTHKCTERCHKKIKYRRSGAVKGHERRRSEKCKYGFPAPLSDVEYMDIEGRKMIYVRREEEDRNIVSYNLELLVNGYRHHNVMKIGETFPIQYIVKYITKIEKEANIKLPKKTGSVAKYLTRRTMGAAECAAILCQIPQCLQSIEVVFISTQLNPKSRVIKRLYHQPENDDSTDIYYDTPFEKYLQRPLILKDITYKDFYETYRYITERKRRIEPKLPRPDGREKEFSSSESEEDDWYEEEKPKKKVKTPRQKDRNGRIFMKRKFKAITRTEYFYKFGVQQKKWLMQVLMLNVPWINTEENNDFEHLKSIEKEVSSLIEECDKHNLLSTELDNGVELLEDAVRRGVPRYRLDQLAIMLKDKEIITEEQIQRFINQYDLDNLPPGVIDGDESSDDEEQSSESELLNRRIIAVGQFANYEKQFTEPQRKTFEYIRQRLDRNEKIKLCIQGEAGTGKTFLIKALIAYLQESTNLKFEVLASTGAAASNISGTTAYRFLRMDYQRNCRLSYRTYEAQRVIETQLIIFDEISMVTRELFDDFIYYLWKFSKRGYDDHRSSFGGKHLIFLGDFRQLPAIGNQIWQSQFFGPQFKFLALTEVKRQTDNDFKRILKKLRILDFDLEVKNLLEDRARRFRNDSSPIDQVNRLIQDRNNSFDPKVYEDIMILVPTRNQRNEYNKLFLDQIEGEIFSCRRTLNIPELDRIGEGILAVDSSRTVDDRPPQIPNDFVMSELEKGFTKLLQLKIGAKVVLTRNYDTHGGWVNGTLARIKAINESGITLTKLSDPDSEFVVFRETQTITYYNVEISRNQFPIELAYSLTIHKAQGLTVCDKMYLVIDKVFNPAQLYVGFSRVTTKENLFILGYDENILSKLDNRRKTWRFRKIGELLEWIDKVNVISPNPQKIQFPNTFMEDYEYVNPEDRPGEQRFDPGEKDQEEEPDDSEDENEPEREIYSGTTIIDSQYKDDSENEYEPDINTGTTIIDSENKGDSENGESESESDFSDSFSDYEYDPAYDFIHEKPKDAFEVEPLPSPKLSEQMDEPMEIDKQTEKFIGSRKRPYIKSSTVKVMTTQMSELSIEEVNKWIDPTTLFDDNLNRELNDRAKKYLIKLFRDCKAYKRDMKHLTNSFDSEMQKFARTMKTRIRLYPERSFSMEDMVNKKLYKIHPHENDYLDEIDMNTGLYRILETKPDGHCFYNAISQHLTGRQNLSMLLRFLVVFMTIVYTRSKYCQDKENLGILQSSLRRKNGGLMPLTIVENTFAAGYIYGDYNADVFPPRINPKDIYDYDIETIYYAHDMQRFFMSELLERPLLTHNKTDMHFDENRIKYGCAHGMFGKACCWENPPLIIHFNINHYNCILVKEKGTIMNKLKYLKIYIGPLFSPEREELENKIRSEIQSGTRKNIVLPRDSHDDGRIIQLIG